jgi:hypothetical protein
MTTSNRALNSERLIMKYPDIAVSLEARELILKKGGVVSITKNRRAGRYGYAIDSLVIDIGSPESTDSFVCINSDGIDFYLSNGLELENFDQINVWMQIRYKVIKTLRARITLYRSMHNV